MGFLWPKELRDHWLLRFPAALAAAAMLLLAGFVVGSLWTLLGEGFTTHTLMPFAHDAFDVPYIGRGVQVVVIFMMVFTRFCPFVLVVLLLMPFFGNAKWRPYVLSFIPFMFYGWFFAVQYVINH